MMKVIDWVLEWMIDLAFDAPRKMLKRLVIIVGSVIPAIIYLFAVDKWGWWWGAITWLIVFLLNLVLVISALVDGARVGEPYDTHSN